MEKMNSEFEIVTLDETHETNLETVYIWFPTSFPIVPSENSTQYLASNTHVGGYSVGNPCEWCIQVNPNYMDNGKRYISLFLWLHKFLRRDKPVHKQSVHVMYQFELRVMGTLLKSKFSSIHKFTEQKSCYGFKKFMPFPKPHANSDAQSCVASLANIDWNVNIKATIMIIRDINDFVFPSTVEDKCSLLNSDGDGESSSPAIEDEIEKRRKLFFVNHAVKEKISEMRKTGKNADVIIRSERKEHNAHMEVLLARCKNQQIPVQLEKIRGKEMKIIELKSFQDNVVSAVLDYCYDGHSKQFIIYKKIIPIFLIASKLHMAPLVNQCLIELASCITPKYFFAVLKISLHPSADIDAQLRICILRHLQQYFRNNHVAIRDSLVKPHIKEQAQYYLAKLFLM